MMQIYLVHPRHGKKIAIHETEAEADKKNGWKEVAEEQFYPKPKQAEAVKSEPEKAGQDESLVSRYTEKHGKKPRHRMSNESIREALNDDSAEA